MNKQKLASTIWESANEMRSKIEANEYKDFILGFIFYKYLSESEVRFFRSEQMTDEDIEQLDESDEEFVGYVKDKSDISSSIRICSQPGLVKGMILTSPTSVPHSPPSPASSGIRTKKYLTRYSPRFKPAFPNSAKVPLHRQRPSAVLSHLLIRFLWMESRTMMSLASSMNI